MKKIILTFSWCFAILSPIAVRAANSDISPSSNTVIAEVDGVKVTLGEVEQKRADELFQARTGYYQAQRKAVDNFISDYLLKREAEREHLTVEQLLDRHVKSAVPPDPTEESLRVYYEGVDTNEPYERVRERILEHLRQRRLEKARATYMQALKSRANVVIHLAPPKANIQLAGAPLRGLGNAPVVIVEYADYECPYCQEIEPALKKLEAEYEGKLALAYKDVPLPMHANAQKAAEAAHCAGVQGQYWEYHDLLFATKEVDVAKLKQHARTLNLNTLAFDKCLDSGEEAALVKGQLLEAQRLGLAGTPTFFVNGHLLSGTVKYETIRELLEQEMAAASAESKGDPRAIKRP